MSKATLPAVTDTPNDAIGREISREEAQAIFDRQAQRYLGIGGEEFLRRWRAGEYAGELDEPGIMDLIMLLPLVQE